MTLGVPLYAYDEVDSTQETLRELARAGAGEGTVVVAEHQRQGRGRRGRSWTDRPGDSLLFSVLLVPSLAARDVPQLSLLAAVAVAEAVERETSRRPAIKWPNDLLLGGRKFVGLLPEAELEGSAVARVMLGIGVNVGQHEFPPELAGATSLALETGRTVDRRTLLAAILERLEQWYTALPAQGFGPVHGEWRRRAVTLGRHVVIGGIAGVALGLDTDGALLVRDDAQRVVRVTAGEVQEVRGTHAPRH